MVAWLCTALYYLYQYALRSAPAAMMPQLSAGFAISAAGAASLVGLFYYAYAPFSLVAGIAVDRWGARAVVPAGAVVVGIGALLFAIGNKQLAIIGMLAQGAGGVFALVGAVYIATKSFHASRAGTLLGATQMLGMAGGFLGQFLGGALIAAGAPWRTFWLVAGGCGIALGAALFVVLPHGQAARRYGWKRESAQALLLVIRNPQSILCGLIAGLLFLPTTIFGMVWGVRYLQEAHGLDYGAAVMRSSTVPLGWIIGAPLLGFLSDRIGLRKPVIVAGASVLLASLAWILFGRPDLLPPYILGFVAGVSSGAAMLPYTVAKEVNPAGMSGTATGVVNFLNYAVSAVSGSVFGGALTRVSGGAIRRSLEHYQTTFAPLLFCVGLAILLLRFLRETGPASRPQLQYRAE